MKRYFSPLSIPASMPIFRKFLHFTGVGVIGTLIHYAVLIGLTSISNLSPIVASGTGFVLGAFANYILNYHYTFQSKKHHDTALMKFMSVASIGLVLNTLILGVLTEIFIVPYLFAQILATGVVLIWNFFANLLWTFHE